jgi:crotonobetainyl-CoA:carnitine CoA-transferase CaiB-like acyl-CoA transferase
METAEKDAVRSGENPDMEVVEPTGAQDSDPQPAGTAWIGVALGGTVLVGALAILIFRRRGGIK